MRIVVKCTLALVLAGSGIAQANGPDVRSAKAEVARLDRNVTKLYAKATSQSLAVKSPFKAQQRHATFKSELAQLSWQRETAAAKLRAIDVPSMQTHVADLQKRLAMADQNMKFKDDLSRPQAQQQRAQLFSDLTSAQQQLKTMQQPKVASSPAGISYGQGPMSVSFRTKGQSFTWTPGRVGSAVDGTLSNASTMSPAAQNPFVNGAMHASESLKNQRLFGPH